MVTFLRNLSLLFLLLLIRNNVYAQSNACYCTTPWTANAVFGQSCTANTSCWACAPGAYTPSWQQAFCSGYQAPPPVQVTCTTSFTEKTEACPVHNSGIKRYKQETKTCTDGTVSQTAWLLYSNSCVQDPPTCQVSSQVQTIACQTGYTGLVTQTQTSTCPDPYGSPIWSAWVTTSSTCVKSLSNPTNPTSPVSPISPTNQIAPVVSTPNVTTGVPVVNASMDVTGSATAMESSPASTTSPSPTASTGTSSAQSQEKSVTPAPAQSNAKETPKASQSPSSGAKDKLSIGGLGRALSLELFVKPGIVQPNVFPDVSINQSIPKEIRLNSDLMMELLNIPLPTQNRMMLEIIKDTVEYEQ